MAIVSQEQFDEWSPEYRAKYHEWCWFKDYGNCDLCAIYINSINKDRSPKVDSGAVANNNQQTLPTAGAKPPLAGGTCEAHVG